MNRRGFLKFGAVAPLTVPMIASGMAKGYAHRGYVGLSAGETILPMFKDHAALNGEIVRIMDAGKIIYQKETRELAERVCGSCWSVSDQMAEHDLFEPDEGRAG